MAELKEIAVSGCTLSKQEATITTPPSSDVLINNKGVYKGTILITVSDSKGDNGKVVNGDGKGVASLTGSGENVLVNSEKVVLKGDKITVNIVGTQPSASGSVTAYDTVEVEIQDAGQSDVKAS